MLTGLIGPVKTIEDARLTRIQFAFAGMNAHINRDLAVALDRMATPDGRFPSRDSARYPGNPPMFVDVPYLHKLTNENDIQQRNSENIVKR